MNHLSSNRLGALLLAAALTVSAQAADKFTLAAKEFSAPGTETSSVDITTLGEAKLTMEGGGQKMEGTMFQKQTETTETKVLSPQKLRILLKDTKTEGKMTLNGESQEPPPEDAELKGVPVIAEQKGETWTFTREEGGDELTEELRTKLETDSFAFNDYRESLAIYGTDAHAVGDKWTVDASKLPVFLGLLTPKGSINVEITGTEKVGGAEAATVKMTFDFTGSSKDGLEAHVVGESTGQRLIEAKVYTSLKIKGKTDVKASPQEGVNLTMNGPLALEHTATVKKP